MSGNGVGPVLAYDFVVGSHDAKRSRPTKHSRCHKPAFGDKTTATIALRNTGNFEGTISSIALVGYCICFGKCPFLPLTLAAGGSASFNINFVPTQTGTLTARLKIGDANFQSERRRSRRDAYLQSRDRDGQYDAGSSSTVFFIPAQVGSTSSCPSADYKHRQLRRVHQQHQRVGTATGVFTLTDLPALP
jgi:hypothetical protein